MKNKNLTLQIEKALLIFLGLSVISLSISMAVSSISFVISVILWVSILVIEKRWIKTPMDWLFVLFIIVEIISTIFSVNQNQSLVNMKRIFIFSFFYMTFYSLKSEKDLKIFLIVFFSFVSLLSVIEIIMKYILVIDRIGVFQHYMTTGGIKMIVCLIMIPFIFSKDLSIKSRTIVLVLFLPILTTLVLTLTRSSWLGLLFGIIVFAIFKNKMTLIYLAILIIAFSIFAPQNAKQRALSSFNPNHFENQTRIHMFKTGLRIFQNYPIVGIGDVDVKKTYLEYTIPFEENEGGHLHNNFTQILVSFGIIGFTVFISMFTVLLIYIYKTYKMVKNIPHLSSIAVIPIMVFFAFHVNGLFEWNFGDQEIAILLWFTMGLSVFCRLQQIKIETEKIII